MATDPFIIGWQEWIALPELGLPAIKAKIDTGARTSALHAFLIEPFGPATAPMVRFGVQPIPGRLDVRLFCSAPIVDRREVTSSNGERETRYFIRTPVALGGRTWEIEVGLTNRETMAYRMLLGRQAIRDDMMVEAASSFRQPRLSYKLYRGLPRPEPIPRALRIALVSPDADAPFNRLLAETAGKRGHVMELLDFDRLSLTFEDDLPGVSQDGRLLAHYDAVVPRLGRSEKAAGAAIVRQLEAMGSVALNSGDAIDRVRNRLATAQALVRDRVPQNLHAAAPVAPTRILRVLVVGGEAMGVVQLTAKRAKAANIARHRTERRLAEHAAAALGLGLASIEVVLSNERHVVTRVSARPALELFARACDVDVASAIIDALETSLRARKPADS